MGKFNKSGFGGDRRGGDRGGRDFGRKNFGGDRRGGDRGGRNSRSSGPVSMHKAVCSDCGNSCEVPFRPTGDKPVFCSDCFGGKKDTGFRSEKRDRSNNKASFSSNSSKDRSFEGSKDIAELKRKVEELHGKLDALLSIVDSKNTVVERAPKKEVVEKKVKAPAKKESKAPAKKTVKKVAKAKKK